MIRVLLVDEHNIVRIGLKKLLADIRDIYVIDEAASGAAAIQLALEKHPDVILMDMRLPDKHGLDVTREIRSRCPYIKIIVLTAQVEESYALEMLEAGIAGYLTKDIEIEEIIEAIRQVQAGYQYFQASIAKSFIRVPLDIKATSFESLSNREREVMDLLVEGHSIQEISDKLNLNIKTVSTYRYRLFEKLKIKNNIELTKLVAKHELLAAEQIDWQA